MIAWHPFLVGEATYDLSHLHPRRIEFVQPAKGDVPERSYQVQLIYGLHCFTRSPAQDEAVDPAWHYGDSRETRIFCPRRYAMSRLLPGIVEGLAARPAITPRGAIFSSSSWSTRLASRSSMRSISRRRVRPSGGC